MEKVKTFTERLVLRDNELSDLNNLHALLTNKENLYFLDDISTNSITQTAENLRVAVANADGHYFAICEKESGEYVGQVGYTIVSLTPFGKIVHLGYFIMPEFINRGYTTEAVKKTVEFAFSRDDCYRIETGCYSENLSSRRVLEKSGFRLEGTKIKAVLHDGIMKDRLEFALNKEEFFENFAKSIT